MSFSTRKYSGSAVRLTGRASKLKRIAMVGIAVCFFAALAKVLFFSGQTYLVLTEDLTAGAPIAQAKFTQVQAQLGALGATYLAAGERPKGYAGHTILAGSLIARTDLIGKPPEGFTRVVVASKTPVSKVVRVGSLVQVWSVKRVDNELQAPVLLAEQASVAQLIKPEGVFGSQNQQVDLLVDNVAAPAILDSVAADAALFLVPLS